MPKPIVPVLITCDFDPTPEVTDAKKRAAMEKILDLFDEYDIRSTLFITAKYVDKYINKAILKKIEGHHEIACHGLTHAYDEEWNRMSEAESLDRLSQATVRLEKQTGKKITSFRGPRVKTSVFTQDALEVLGYRIDSSVCSQRIDFVSSNLINPNWIFAPRLPYHPHKKTPFKKGKRNLWVIPVSAIILPFVSGLIYTFGLNIIKTLFRALYWESLRNGKPIVYLLHPVEFVPDTIKITKPKNFKFLFVEGFQFRYRFYNKDIKKRYAQHQALFSFIRKFPYIRFMTMNEYVQFLENRNKSEHQ